jgi:hypothetical protein
MKEVTQEQRERQMEIDKIEETGRGTSLPN